jgi:hypothetical protein
MQLGALVAAARASSPMDAALITLLGLLGLRIFEACSVDLEDFGVERGHRTLHIIGKGGKPALLPLPPPVARTLDLAADERGTGPLLLTSTGRRMDRYAATRIVHGLAKKAGIAHHIGCHSLRHSYITAAPRRRRPAPRRPDCRPARRPENHHPLRPRPRQPRPPRQLHRRRIHRRQRLTEHKNRHYVRMQGALPIFVLIADIGPESFLRTLLHILKGGYLAGDDSDCAEDQESSLHADVDADANKD